MALLCPFWLASLPEASHFHPCQPTTNREIILKHLSGVALGSETYASSCSVPPSKLPLLDCYGFFQPTLDPPPNPHHCSKCVFVYAWNAPALPHPSRAHPTLSMVVLRNHLSGDTIYISQCNSLLFCNCIIYVSIVIFLRTGTIHTFHLPTVCRALD